MLGRLSKSRNLDKKTTASSSYYRVLVVKPKGEFETLLLTANDLERIRERVKKNPEDEIYPTWLDRAISFLRASYGCV